MIKISFIVYGPSNVRSIFGRANSLLEEEGWKTIQIKSIIELEPEEEFTKAKFLVNAKVGLV